MTIKVNVTIAKSPKECLGGTNGEVNSMMTAIWFVLVAVAALFFGFGIGYFIRKSIAEAKISSAEEAAAQIVENAKKRQKR